MSDNLADTTPFGSLAGALGDGLPRQRLYARIATRIVGLAEAEGIAPGARLPSETDLAERLGVSRATVREALVALEAVGAVTIRRGAGAVLSGGAGRLNLRGIGGEPGALEILELRRVVEPESARLAARRGNDENWARMEDAIRRMVEENRAGFRTEDGDREFHVEVARASGNGLILSLVRDLWQMREAGLLWAQIQSRMSLTDTRPKAVFQHMQILQRLRDREEEAAAEAMRAHVETTIGQVRDVFAVMGA